MIKLSVGSGSLDDLRAWQKRYGAMLPPLRHGTRNFPKRAAEICDGGSIYWVINRIVTTRQRVLDITHGTREDGSACTNLILDPNLVPVQGRFVKPFQGWRYLAGKDAPPDTESGPMGAVLPEKLQRELASLCLI